MQSFNEINRHIVLQPETDPPSLSEHAVWIDLLNPTRAEEQMVEEFLQMEIPTREEMSEIEVSNRLYTEHGTYYMTTTMVSKVDTGTPETHAVTFMLTNRVLVTIRYVDSTSFRRYMGSVTKLPTGDHDGVTLFLGLTESIVNRMADILERLDRDIDRITKDVFRRTDGSGAKEARHYQQVLERIGRCGDLCAKTHESLVTFSRVAAYATHHKKACLPENQLELDGIRRDISGLIDHVSYLTNRVNFLLDATLGMISIEQDSVFRVLSIASLIFMPPTLVAGIYGMNFKLMPELEWHYGYPLAMLLMGVAAILPYAYLKRRGVL